MPTQLRLHIETREPFAEGVDFAEVGPYERLAGSTGMRDRLWRSAIGRHHLTFDWLPSPCSN